MRLLNDVRQFLPRPTAVAMAAKYKTKSSITRLVYEISQIAFLRTWGFQGQAMDYCQSNFTTTDPVSHGNEI